MPIQGDTSNRYGDPQGEIADRTRTDYERSAFTWEELQRRGSLRSWMEAKRREGQQREEVLDALGVGWQLADEYIEDRREELRRALEGYEWQDTAPDDVDAHECRIGLSKFFVPPISININQVYKSGAINQGALRSPAPPKTNTGHRETVIQMTLYFPTYESIWGVEDDVLNIRFDRGQDPLGGTSRPMDGWDPRRERTVSTAPDIDRFMSTLRGLIAQFKYAPFLPIRNAYINQVFGITGVTLKDITLSTVPNFPMCMAVHLTMYKFNHKVYLPMVEDFHQALHWGRYRSYCGRAIGALARASTPIKVWAEQDQIANPPGDLSAGSMVPIIRPISDVVRENNPTRIGSTQTFTRHTAMQISDFEFYFPFHTPQRVDVPSTAFITDEGRAGYADGNYIDEPRWVAILRDNFGYNIDTNPEARLDAVKDAARSTGGVYIETGSNRRLLRDFLREQSIRIEDMTPGRLNSFINRYIQEHNISGDGRTQASAAIRAAWFQYIYLSVVESPHLAHALAMQAQRERRLTINEWELPMFPLNMDMDYVEITGVTVSLGNNVARLQLQMEDEPTHQHIGGADSRVDIAMVFHGERGKEQLMKLRMMFDTISGLARLEQGHGVLGFLGIKSSIAALAGIRYVLPLNFTVDTIPNYPNTFEVNISLTDFDIFQQKREELNATMQARMANDLGKLNPFFRIKQAFNLHNSYPDFPLSIHSADSDDVIGYLDPDYYFRSFKVIDDDIVAANPVRDRPNTPFIEQVPYGSYDDERLQDQERVNVTEDIQDAITYVLPRVDGNVHAISIENDGSMVHTTNGQHDATAVMLCDSDVGAMAQTTPTTPELLPGYSWNQPYIDNSNSPSAQFHAMARDMQYRDNSGRMIRAFPTYMLWLIDEAGNSFGMNLMDNIYGLQSVIDVSIVRSEDVLNDTMVLRISNLYSKLTTKLYDTLNESGTEESTARIINRFITRYHRLLTGMSNDYVADIGTTELRPGIRVHLRMGYGSNPGKLETVFNGTITEVEEGAVLTVVAQSDAMELGAYVETENEKGSSGRIDGSFMGLYMSEPRDLMVTLLSQGASRTREFIALATRGDIYSENRYGIRHFGGILYTYMDGEERDDTGAIKNTVLSVLEKRMQRVAQRTMDGSAMSGPAESVYQGFGGMAGLISMAFSNLASSRDYEVFKRNIYPGNGLGIAQYLGGDLGDIGLGDLINDRIANESESYEFITDMGIDGEGQPQSLSMVQSRPDLLIADAVTPVEDEEEPPEPQLSATQIGLSIISPLYGSIALAGYAPRHEAIRNVSRLLGLSEVHQDEGPFDEVSFRANTYMKTVWDMFETCAALLPDYIVAVRPFEDRSTVFYGKPHWLYTSGLIPATTGPLTDNMLEHVMGPDYEFQQLLDDIQMEMHQEDSQTAFERFANEVSLWDGTRSPARFEIRRQPGSMPLSSDGGIPSESPDGYIDTGDPSVNVSINPGTSGLPVGVGYNVGGTISSASTVPVGVEDARHTTDSMYGTAPDFSSDRHVTWSEIERFFESRLDSSRRGIVSESKFIGTFRIAAGREVWYAFDDSDWNNTGVGTFSRRIGAATSRGFKLDTDVSFEVSGDNAFFRLSDEAIRDSGLNETSQDRALAEEGAYADSYAEELGSLLDAPEITWEEAFSNVDPVWLEVFVDIVDNVKTATQAREVLDQFFGEGWDSVFGDQMSAVRDMVSQVAGSQPSSDVGIESSYGQVPDNVGIQMPEDASGTVSNEEFDMSSIDISDYTATEIVMMRLGHPYTMFNTSNPDSEAAQAGADATPSSFPSFAEDYHAINAFFSSRYVAYLGTEEKLAVYDQVYNEVISQFFDWVENNPFVAAWLVRTASRETVRWFSFGAGRRIWDRHWSYDHMYTVFNLFCSHGTAAAEEYMAQNWQAGRRGAGFWGSVTAGLIDRDWGWTDEAQGGAGGALGALFANAMAGMAQLAASTMITLTQGMSLATDMQARTNILNRTLNDSRYYRRGRDENGNVTSPLLNYVDNPFTREYGEPVVEVREPFQRIHTLSSYQHIINNRIVESIHDIPTVVTAHSNDGDPVTVFLDKGMPPHRQVERTIDTGLYWDQPDGWLGLESIVKPIQATRNLNRALGAGRQSDGIPSNISAKRVGLYNLKKGLEKLYQGELTIIGDASIRPHDLAYIFDVYSRIYGFAKVRQVVHHFTPEMGFITQVTPGLMVNINDPARWNVQARWRGTLAIHSLRETARRQFQNLQDEASRSGYSQGINFGEQGEVLVDMFEDQIQGSLQYTAGMGNMLTNSMSTLASGNFAQRRLGQAAAGATGPLFSSIPLIGPVLGGITSEERGLLWAPYRWYRDNLLDQQGCTVDFLTKNGSPMDGNLSYGEGIAVGQPRTNRLILFGLNVATIPRIDDDGNTIIQTSDLIKSTRWHETDGINEQFREIDLFHDATLAAVRETAFGQTFIDNFESEVYGVLFRVADVYDADTIDVTITRSYNGDMAGKQTLRLFGSDAAEDDYQNAPQSVIEERIAAGDIGVIATQWLKQVIRSRPNEVMTAVMRVPKVDRQDQFDRTLGYLYWNAPDGLEGEDRMQYLFSAAGDSPVKPWDSYTPDGKPHTLDWELILKGYGHTYSNSLREVFPGRGA